MTEDQEMTDSNRAWTRAPAPRRLRWLIAGFALSGAALLVVAAAGVAGAGPLAG